MTSNGTDHILRATPPGVTVVGVGGCGGNSIHRLKDIPCGNAKRVIVSADARSLADIDCPTKVLIGPVGRAPDAGPEGVRAAATWAEAAAPEIGDACGSPTLAFLCVGLGGATGAGAAPVVARIARDAGAHVVVFAYMPFRIEGRLRRRNAEDGLESLRGVADTVLVIHNDKLYEFAPDLPIGKAFRILDTIVGALIRELTDCLGLPSYLREMVELQNEPVTPHFEVVSTATVQAVPEEYATQYVHVNYGQAAQSLAAGSELPVAVKELGAQVSTEVQRGRFPTAPANVTVGDVAPAPAQEPQAFVGEPPVDLPQPEGPRPGERQQPERPDGPGLRPPVQDPRPRPNVQSRLDELW